MWLTETEAEAVGWIVRGHAAPRRPRALLADVDEPTVAVVGHRLERAGLDVTLARTGPEAFDAALADLPDVLVAASRLPGLDGLALFARLREALPKPPPTVLVFWPGNASAVARALDAGVDDVIVRPLSLVEVVARIRRFV